MIYSCACGFAYTSKGNIRPGVDGFAVVGIDGAGVFLGMFESGVAEE